MLKKKLNTMNEVKFYRKYQRDGIYNYYKLEGPVYTSVNFLNSSPIVSENLNTRAALFNSIDIIEGGEEISEQEYLSAYERAIESPELKFVGLDGKVIVEEK